jgi:hypothetical protein
MCNNGLHSQANNSPFWASSETKVRRPNRIGIVFTVLICLAFSASAEAAPTVATFAAKSFPDNADLRGKLFAYVIGASRDVALAYGERQLQSVAGPVTVRVEKRNADFIVEFLNANASIAGEAGRGSCFIQRGNAKGNYILQARILLEDDPSCYLSLYPSGSGTRGDIVMYGAVVKKGLYLSDMIYRILLLSFSDIVDATSRSFDWGGVFKFGPKSSDADYASELRSAELRTALASARPSSEQAPGPSAAASAAPIALGSATAKIALAAAPALPAPAGQDAVAKGPRSLRIACAIDRAASPETLVLDLASSGDSGAREISLSPDGAPAFVYDRGDPLSKIAYADFPRYDAKGLPFAALRAAVFLDLQSNPDSVYALIGEGIRATVVPSYDEAGRLNFAVFSGGKESSWDELSAGRHDLKARLVRVPS